MGLIIPLIVIVIGVSILYGASRRSPDDWPSPPRKRAPRIRVPTSELFFARLDTAGRIRVALFCCEKTSIFLNSAMKEPWEKSVSALHSFLSHTMTYEECRKVADSVSRNRRKWNSDEKIPSGHNIGSSALAMQAACFSPRVSNPDIRKSCDALGTVISNAIGAFPGTQNKKEFEQSVYQYAETLIKADD